MVSKLYRAKIDRHGGDWIVGYLVEGTFAIGGEKKSAIVPTCSMIFPSRRFSKIEFVIPDTICKQLDLKDKNGTIMYEGDIIQTPTNVMVIESCDVGTNYIASIVNPSSFIDYIWLHTLVKMVGYENIEVIGNIYDNQQLLNEVKKTEEIQLMAIPDDAIGSEGLVHFVDGHVEPIISCNDTLLNDTREFYTKTARYEYNPSTEVVYRFENNNYIVDANISRVEFFE